ncbi:MAG: FKBP-type peptidyl-prolyl cis-trans isomerase [Colwellia sp.]|nr:FKBP-type peptidyl-prolyl cis-trans isomerase [Colwellia sp.]
MKYVVLVIVVALAIFFFTKNSNDKKLAIENMIIAKDFLAKNKSLENVVETASGLQYQVLEKGEGTEHPTATSKVTVHYHGTVLDGSVFESTVESGNPISFGLNQVIPGWTEGVQLMVVGDKFKFFIPANLAYGNTTSGKIKAGSLIMFEITLLEIQ